jgi:hypothetical protein
MHRLDPSGSIPLFKKKKVGEPEYVKMANRPTNLFVLLFSLHVALLLKWRLLPLHRLMHTAFIYLLLSLSVSLTKDYIMGFIGLRHESTI